VSLDPKNSVGATRQLGNIYERLNAARRRRERLLETPFPANDDRQVPRRRAAAESFPALKKPRPEPPVRAAREWSRAVPWLLGALIFAVVSAFAVG
jgi:hypothetical protein